MPFRIVGQLTLHLLSSFIPPLLLLLVTTKCNCLNASTVTTPAPSILVDGEVKASLKDDGLPLAERRQWKSEGRTGGHLLQTLLLTHHHWHLLSSDGNLAMDDNGILSANNKADIIRRLIFHADAEQRQQPENNNNGTVGKNETSSRRAVIGLNNQTANYIVNNVSIKINGQENNRQTVSKLQNINKKTRKDGAGKAVKIKLFHHHHHNQHHSNKNSSEASSRSSPMPPAEMPFSAGAVITGDGMAQPPRQNLGKSRLLLSTGGNAGPPSIAPRSPGTATAEAIQQLLLPGATISSNQGAQQRKQHQHVKAKKKSNKKEQLLQRIFTTGKGIERLNESNSANNNATTILVRALKLNGTTAVPTPHKNNNASTTNDDIKWDGTANRSKTATNALSPPPSGGLFRRKDGCCQPTHFGANSCGDECHRSDNDGTESCCCAAATSKCFSAAAQTVVVEVIKADDDQSLLLRQDEDCAGDGQQLYSLKMMRRPIVCPPRALNKMGNDGNDSNFVKRI